MDAGGVEPRTSRSGSEHDNRYTTEPKCGHKAKPKYLFSDYTINVDLPKNDDFS